MNSFTISKLGRRCGLPLMASTVALFLLVACSSSDGSSDAGVDAGSDASAEASVDTGADVGADQGVEAGVDSGADAEPDAQADAFIAPEFVCVPPDVSAAPRLTGPRSNTNLRIAVIPLLFSDQSVSDVPTRQAIADKLGGCDIQRLFYDSSTGQAAYEVEVMPWQNVARTQDELIGGDLNISDAEMAPVNVTLPQISADTHFLIFFAAFDEQALGGIPGSWTFMDYGGIPDPRPSLNGQLVEHMMLLTTAQAEVDRARGFGFVSFDPRTGEHASQEGLIEGEGRPIDDLQATFAHEMVHYLGHGPHANSWDKGERFFFEPADVDAEAKENYGNHFALLGVGGCLSPVMHSVYRRYVGWGQRLEESLASGEDRRLTLAPINRLEGVTSVSFVTDEAAGIEITLELREDDGWHDFMASSPLLAGNLDGIMVLVREGQGRNSVSYLIDASPMPRATTLFPGQDLKAFEDVVLKPGMELHMPWMSLSEVRAEADNHLSVRVQTFATAREILHRPVRPTLSRNGNTATVTWAGSTHAATTGFEVEVIAADGTKETTTVSGAGETSASLDVSGLDAGGELHARVRAVGGGHAANWSRDAYIQQ